MHKLRFIQYIYSFFCFSQFQRRLSQLFKKHSIYADNLAFENNERIERIILLLTGNKFLCKTDKSSFKPFYLHFVDNVFYISFRLILFHSCSFSSSLPATPSIILVTTSFSLAALSEVIIGFPVCASMFFLASPAIFPPLCATSLFSSKP